MMCLPGGRERRVVHGRDGQFEQRALATGGRTWRRPRRARRTRCWGRCASSPCGAGPARRDSAVNSGRPFSARLILQLVPSMRKLPDGGTKSAVQVAASSSRRKVSLGSRLRGHHRRLDLLAAFQHHAARAAVAHQDLAPPERSMRISDAAWRAPRRRWLPTPRPCRRARSPTARDGRPRRPCSGAAGCRPCPASAGRRWRRSRRRWPA